jgi:N4-(beta-N-acetylglucosaminyl)-L-asparaginase
MSRNPTSLGRRAFLRATAAAGAGLAVFGRAPRIWARGLRAGGPFIITSHTNATGQHALEEAWKILGSGGSALDAVEKGANVVEVDPEDTSVGYGGLPNAQGVVQLDASIMDGRTYSAGAVGALEGIKTPSSVARRIMEHTDHIMLVGRGAQEFATSFGFKVENLLTEKARREWVRWRERLSPTDKYGPPEHLRGLSAGKGLSLKGAVEFHHGTVNVLAVDANGDIAGVTTTSGYAWKVPGRVGDSPILGDGLYVDNEVGAAGATGRGEDVMKSCATYYIVMRMRDGRSPQQACEDAVQMIIDRYRKVNPKFVPSEKFVAINKAGDVGCASMGIGGTPRMRVQDTSGQQFFTGKALYKP